MELERDVQDDTARLFAGQGEMAGLCRDHEWSATPLGPTEAWSPALRTAARAILASQFPMALWCGPSLTLIYNDGYGRLLGARHPAALGQPCCDVWRELWPAIEPMFDLREDAQSTYADAARFEVNQADGTLGEGFFTFAMSPVRDESGTVVAFLNVTADMTARVEAEREKDRARDSAERAEQRLRDVFAQAPAFLAVLRGPDHVFEFANDAYVLLVGRHALVGRTVQQALPEVAEQGFVQLLDEVYRTRRPYVGREIPILLRRTAGAEPEQVYVDFVYQPLLSADGAVEGIVAHGSDVTDAVRARQLVEANEERYRFLADAIPVQVWTATLDGALDYVNHPTELYFGVPASQLVGDGWQSGVEPADLAQAGVRWAESLATGAPYQVEFRLRRADGVYRWHLSRATVQRSADGQMLRWFGTNTDVEMAKQHEAELQRLTREATEASRAKSDFLAAMSHELRTPLNAIGGYAQLIELGVRGPVNAEQVEDLRKIQRSKDHLNTLVGGVLAFAKGGTGRIEIDTIDIDVGELLESVLDMIGPQLVERSLTLRRDAVPEGLALRADLDKTRQIILNLLANALKFTSPGGTITVTAEEQDGRTAIAVRDTGIGVPPDKIDRIFEPFVQAKRSIQSRDGGVGLGLAISRQLARAMEGDVTVTSVLDVGSTFTLTLPVGSRLAPRRR